MALFGTDGIRGRAGVDLTDDLAQRVGSAAARVLAPKGVRRVVLVRDTRASGESLEAAFCAGWCEGGLDLLSAGIAPTPVVSHLLNSGRVTDAVGVVISASHNPHEYNGIKFFAMDGTKFSAAQEADVEADVRQSSPQAVRRQVGAKNFSPLQDGLQAGRELLDVYIRDTAARVAGLRARKLPVVIDAAHGAAATTARRLFEPVVERLTVIHEDFNGRDINENCGSTHIETLDARLPDESIGIAFDGDADRMLVRIRHRGVCRTIDGDDMLNLFARAGRDGGKPVVGTSLSNGALEDALRRAGKKLLRSDVGDREVQALMAANGSRIGGEPSGHIIFGDIAKTGDGALTGLMFLDLAVRIYGESIDRLTADLFTPFPQKLLGVTVREKRKWEDDPELARAVDQARADLGPAGRLVLRYSGTEPLFRIFAEGPQLVAVDRVSRQLQDVFTRRLGGST